MRLKAYFTMVIFTLGGYRLELSGAVSAAGRSGRDCRVWKYIPAGESSVRTSGDSIGMII
jgi:hypothetical protein